MQLRPVLSLVNLIGSVQGINFGGLSFSEPREFPPVLMPLFAGIYAILVPDARFSPRQFRLLYFGETTDLGKRVCDQHEKFGHWRREANGQPLYFAYCSAAGETDGVRKNLEAALIKQYDPPCNTLLRSLVPPPAHLRNPLW